MVGWTCPSPGPQAGSRPRPGWAHSAGQGCDGASGCHPMSLLGQGQRAPDWAGGTSRPLGKRKLHKASQGHSCSGIPEFWSSWYREGAAWMPGHVDWKNACSNPYCLFKFLLAHWQPSSLYSFQTPCIYTWACLLSCSNPAAEEITGCTEVSQDRKHSLGEGEVRCVISVDLCSESGWCKKPQPEPGQVASGDPSCRVVAQFSAMSSSSKAWGSIFLCL